MKKHLLCLLLLLPYFLSAEVRLSHLFVLISDALEEIKNGDSKESLLVLENFKQTFDTTQNSDSAKGMEVKKALEFALRNPKIESLESLSSALIAFEKEQNPVDYGIKRKQFEKRVMPLFKLFEKETRNKNVNAIPALYKRLYDTWQRNERIVGDTSPEHYRQIEIALTFYRLAMVGQNMDFSAMELQTQKLKQALEGFIAGEALDMQSANNAPQTLRGGLELLRSALAGKNAPSAKEAIFTFIAQWPNFEGEVRTRDGKLYHRIESELVEIAAQGATEENLTKLENLIFAIEALDINASYTAFDAAIILLREGIEALLIVIALFVSLKAMHQNQAVKWVLFGAIFGVGASFVTAFVLVALFPLAAGNNREILEGVVGILAVIVMLFVGAWLHSKSSLASWQNYLSRQMGKVLASGSVLSLAGLSFLAVFREGAETILFYAGILPKISVAALLSGIGIAVFLLLIIAFFMQVFAKKLPIHLVFKIMSWFIYCIGFKMLGVSIHALQLANFLSVDILEIPSLVEIGFYNSMQGVIAQALYAVCVLGIVAWNKSCEKTLKGKSKDNVAIP